MRSSFCPIIEERHGFAGALPSVTGLGGPSRPPSYSTGPSLACCRVSMKRLAVGVSGFCRR
jgi:hypothetical protein